MIIVSLSLLAAIAAAQSRYSSRRSGYYNIYTNWPGDNYCKDWVRDDIAYDDCRCYLSKYSYSVDYSTSLENCMCPDDAKQCPHYNGGECCLNGHCHDPKGSTCKTVTMIAAIVGGVVACCCVAACIGGVFYMRKKQAQQQQAFANSNATGPQSQMGTFGGSAAANTNPGAKYNVGGPPPGPPPGQYGTYGAPPPGNPPPSAFGGPPAGPPPPAYDGNSGGSQLPPGWEIKYDPQGQPYYVDHINKKSQYEPPEGYDGGAVST